MSSKDILSAFCQDINADINKSISPSSEDSESNVLLHTYESKCKAILAKINGKEDNISKDHVIKTLKDISQLILDVTYVKEIQLVEDDFSRKSSESDINCILDTLTSLEVLSKTVYPGEDIVTCLGPEIVECLRWRKGALLYMFCHTIHHANPGQGIPSHQLHYLVDGVDYLVSMLKTRSDAKWMDSSKECQNDADDGDTLQLIEQGIFSDTHLLALMYCGEMCYWHTTSCDKTLTHQKHGEEKKQMKVEKQNSKMTCASNTEETCEKEACDKVKTPADATDRVGDLANSKGPEAVISPSACGSGDIPVNTDASAEDSCASNIDPVNSNQTEAVISKMVQIGNSCLKKYLSVAQGPLASAGWNTDRAEDIIGHFQNLKL